MYTFTGGTTNLVTSTLVLNNPTEVTFECFGIAAGGYAIINQQFYLAPYIDSVSGVASVPYKKVFKTNTNEVDFTNYVLTISSINISVIVTCKYYINS